MINREKLVYLVLMGMEDPDAWACCSDEPFNPGAFMKAVSSVSGVDIISAFDRENWSVEKGMSKEALLKVIVERLNGDIEDRDLVNLGDLMCRIEGWLAPTKNANINTNVNVNAPMEALSSMEMFQKSLGEGSIL